jgi:LPXTG-motif cell wall-anchored protein
VIKDLGDPGRKAQQAEIKSPAAVVVVRVLQHQQLLCRNPLDILKLRWSSFVLVEGVVGGRIWSKLVRLGSSSQLAYSGHCCRRSILASGPRSEGLFGVRSVEEQQANKQASNLGWAGAALLSFVGFFFRRRGKAGLVGAAMTFKEGLELTVDPNMNAAAPQGGLLSKSTSLQQQQQPSQLSCNVQQGAGGVDLLLHEHQDVQLGPGGDPEASAGSTTGTPGSSTTGKSVRPLLVSRDTVHRVGQGRSSLESESESESSQLFGQL